MAANERVDRTVAGALGDWRDAERAAAVARRGRVAAEVAASAAAEAAEAAVATADAARTALAAATLAESSAAKTAAAAKLVAVTTTADLADAGSESELADAEEVAAATRYHQAAKDAVDRQAR